MRVEPLYGESAALIGDILVVTDIHVGMEVELRRKGVELPSRGDEKRRRLLELTERTSADRVVLNGDLKHNVPYTSRQETLEVAALLTDLAERAEVTVVPGNHDGGIEDIAPDDVEVAESRGILVDGVGILHGHSLPSDEVAEADTLLLGHTHPKITLWEENGARIERRTWIRIRPNDGPALVVMPAFEEWGGSDVLTDGFLGPLDYSGEADATLLDGTYLGTLDNLTEDES